jgi:photosystem II stability/assembly factor-like uncharacterized protein
MHTRSGRPTLSSLALAAVLVAAPSTTLEAARGSGLGSGPVIIWDGSNDVSISQGGGTTTTLAALGLTRIEDLAARVRNNNENDGRIAEFVMVKLLLHGSTLAATCAAPSAPAFCSRVQRFDEGIGLDLFAGLSFRNGNGPGFPNTAALAATPVVAFTLVNGPAPGLWIPTVADRAVIAQMIDAMGADQIRVGFATRRAPGGSGSDLLEIQDINLALASGSTVAVSAGPSLAHITCLTISADDPSLVFACASPVPPRVVGSAWTDNAEKGLFRSNDGGQTWAAVGAGLPRDVRDVAFSPGLNWLYAAAGTGIYRSFDLGGSWSRIHELPGESPQQATRVAVDPVTGRVYAAYGFSVVRSTDLGNNFVEVPSQLPPWPGQRINRITIAPSGSTHSTIYVDFEGVGDLTSSAILRSTDGGVTWTSVPLAGGPQVHFLDMRVEAVDRTAVGVVYASHGSQMYRSTNSGTTWTFTNNLRGPMTLAPVAPSEAFYSDGAAVLKSTLTGSFVQTLLFEPAVDLEFAPDGSYLLAIANDRLYRSTDRGSTWSTVGHGLPAAPVLDLEFGANGTLLAATSGTPLARLPAGGTQWEFVVARRRVGQFSVNPYALQQLLAVFDIPGDSDTLWRSNDSGNTWSQVTLPPPQPAGGGAEWAAFDPFTTNRLYASADGFFLVSSDNGSGWQSPVPGLSLGEPMFTETPNTFYAVGRDAGFFGVWKTTNGGLSWAPTALTVGTSAAGAHLAYRKLGTTPTLFLAQDRRIHRSTDGGATWTSTDVLASGGITVLISAPTGPASEALIAGTDRGLLISHDDGRSWADLLRPRLEGWPNSRVNAIAAAGATSQQIWFATDAGVWRFDRAVPAAATLTFGPSGGYAMLNVTGVASWQVTIRETWLSLVTPESSGAGDAMLVFRVGANVDSRVLLGEVPNEGPRTGYIDIAGRTLAIHQAAAGCSYTVSPSSASFPDAGGTGTVTLTTATAECAWTAAAPSSFITVTSAATGAGNTVVSYSVAPNAGVSRIGTLIAGGQPVSISQAGSAATIAVDKDALRFSATSDGTRFVNATPPQTVQLIQLGQGAAAWVATSDQPWLAVSPAAAVGSRSADVEIRFVPGLPTSGTLTATISVHAAGGAPLLDTIAVTLQILPVGTSRAPIGTFETPLDNAANVSGSIAVTGWAIDDVGIKSVRIMRDLVAGETGANPTFVGQATLVDGARPDVAAAYPGHPRNSAAGWGYLMLTNMLPDGGNGTFRFHAIVEDEEGNVVSLGTRTILCNNAAATAPFGAIDTPGQGETVSGVVNNFGWVLSRGARRADPPGGGTVRVVVDGVAIGTPFGWTNRADLDQLFPGSEYAGVGTALAVFPLDTTTLSNGVHTIAWSVIDDQGGAEGIGSRFFTVANGASSSASAGFAATAASSGRVESGTDDTLYFRRGYDLEAPLRPVIVRGGRFHIDSEELDRIEIHLGAGAWIYTGRLESHGLVWPLPLGSTLDAQSGVFSWTAGVAFVGSYDLVFTRVSGGDAILEHRVRVVLNPKGMAPAAPVVIDLPGIWDGPLEQPFVIAGWAIDSESETDTGIATLHAWAYPVVDGARGDPLFLGATAYGGERPDVAAVYGERYRRSGFGISVASLPPGQYDLAVFAWSHARGDFLPASVRRVSIR